MVEDCPRRALCRQHKTVLSICQVKNIYKFICFCNRSKTKRKSAPSARANRQVAFVKAGRRRGERTLSRQAGLLPGLDGTGEAIWRGKPREAAGVRGKSGAPACGCRRAQRGQAGLLPLSWQCSAASSAARKVSYCAATCCLHSSLCRRAVSSSPCGGWGGASSSASS